MPSATRAALLDTLARLVATGSTGAGRLVVLTGEAGMGKTTLARALAEVCSRERVLWGACEPMAAARPLLPLHDLARVLGGELAVALAQAEPRRDAFSLLLDALGAQPTLVVVEDAHWADEATLDLLVFLARRVVDLPVTLVVTARTQDPAAGPRVAGVLQHLAALPHGLVLGVPALTLDEVETLTAGSGLDATHVLESTGGNAFFVSELAALGVDRVPDSVREAVLARTAGLGAGTRAVLDCVAVIPDRAELDLVYAASGTSSDDLDAGEHAGLLVSDGRTVAFRHELARTAVAEALTGARRHDLHRAVLAELVRMPGRHEPRIAFHADLADDHDLAVSHGLRAAAGSLAHGAHHEACVQLGRARGHLAHVEPALAGEVLAQQALVLHRVARLTEALDASTAAVGVWRSLDDRDRWAGQLAHSARLLWNLDRTDEARVALAEAVRLADQVTGTAGHLAALTQQAIVLMLSHDISAAVSVGERAAVLAHERGDRAQEAIALNAVGSASWSGDVERAEPLLVAAFELAREVGDDTQAATILVNLGSGAAEIRRYDVARRWLAACRTWCADHDIDLTGDYARAWQARVALEQGEWDQVADLAAPLVESRSPIARMGALTVLGRLAARRGDRSAGELLGAAWDQAAGSGDLQRTWPVAAGHAELGRFDLAEQELDHAARLGHAWAVGELGCLLLRAGRIEADDARLRAAAPPYAAFLAGDLPEAGRAWHDLGCPYDAALVDGDTQDPLRLAAAVVTLHRLGATADSDRVAARLRAIDPALVPRRARRATAADPHGLTLRELEVLALVTEGLTNAEIAARMFISPKTAGHHVSAILAKLGVTSRKEAARLASG